MLYNLMKSDIYLVMLFNYYDNTPVEIQVSLTVNFFVS